MQFSSRAHCLAFSAILFAATVCHGRPLPQKSTRLMHLVETIWLPHVRGRIDHLTLDAGGRRLFVAALGNRTVEVVNLKSRRVIHVISRLRYPQGLAYVPTLRRLVVATAGDGKLRFYNAITFQLLKTLNLESDADDLRYDPTSKTVFVGYGNHVGGIDGVNVKTFKITLHIPVAGHPEAFAIGRKHIYVNSRQYSEIQEFDRATRRIIATWKLRDAAENFPMAYDAGHHVLFIGCRRPDVMIVLDARTGRQLARLKISGGADDMYFDASTGRIYITCGAGVLDVFHESGPEKFELLARIPTAWGGRTSLLDRPTQMFYLAIPHHGNQQAQVRVYQILRGSQEQK